jgi:23S rRNA (cytosine1962-C5)-methyltransferase
MEVLVTAPPCVLYEDEALLVVNKPAGLNTHSPTPHSGEGMYEWLRHRDPRWAKLVIMHRLDKETSGVLIFSKTDQGNRSLTDQFTQHLVRKRYMLLTDGKAPRKELTVKTRISRIGDKYASHASKGEEAITTFRPANAAEVAKASLPSSAQLIVAEPLTGRTHQIRVHAAENGFPVLGDSLYGGSPAPRLFLHSATMECRHPLSTELLQFSAPIDFASEARQALRHALISPALTSACRLIHGASDGWPGWYVDRFEDFLVAESETMPTPADEDRLRGLLNATGASGVYHKKLARQAGRLATTEASPRHWFGEKLNGDLIVRENGLRFLVRLDQGYSLGLFLDQRDNRLRSLTGHIAADFDLPPGGFDVLNTFSYTCGFSICAARHGARTTSIDLSRKYLEWGKSNFLANDIDPVGHDLIYGDTLDWLGRFRKKQRQFDLILLDPPTFSQSKIGGVFRAQKDYGRLVAAALAVLKKDGILFASTNAADWAAEDFIHVLHSSVAAARRKILKTHYVPQPPDFPISREESAYLKTIWLQVG